jgi:hypothetical protein
MFHIAANAYPSRNSLVLVWRQTRDRTRDPGGLSLSAPPVNFCFIRSIQLARCPDRGTIAYGYNGIYDSAYTLRISTTIGGEPGIGFEDRRAARDSP